MTKFYTDKKKRVRPISNRQTSIGSYQTGTAHLSVPKKVSQPLKLNTLIRQAVKEDKDRLVHGNTGKTGFIIVDGKIIQYNKFE